MGMSQNSVPKTTQGLFMVTQYYFLVIKRGKSPKTEVPMGIMMNGGLLGLVVILSDYSMFPMFFPIFPWVFHENCQKRRFHLVDFPGRLTPCARNGRHGAPGIRCADGGVEGPSMEHGAWCDQKRGWMRTVEIGRFEGIFCPILVSIT